MNMHKHLSNIDHINNKKSTDGKTPIGNSRIALLEKDQGKTKGVDSFKIQSLISKGINEAMK